MAHGLFLSHPHSLVDQASKTLAKRYMQEDILKLVVAPIEEQSRVAPCLKGQCLLTYLQAKGGLEMLEHEWSKADMQKMIDRVYKEKAKKDVGQFRISPSL